MEEQGRREEARRERERALSGAAAFLGPVGGTAALVPSARPVPPAGRETPAAAAASRSAPRGGQRVGRGSLPALSARHLDCGPSGAEDE